MKGLHNIKWKTAFYLTISRAIYEIRSRQLVKFSYQRGLNKTKMKGAMQIPDSKFLQLLWSLLSYYAISLFSVTTSTLAIKILIKLNLINIICSNSSIKTLKKVVKYVQRKKMSSPKTWDLKNQLWLATIGLYLNVHR